MDLEHGCGLVIGTGDEAVHGEDRVEDVLVATANEQSNESVCKRVCRT